MSFFLSGALVASGILLGRFLGRRMKRKPIEKTDPPLVTPAVVNSRTVSSSAPAPEIEPDLGLFPCNVGDVVLRYSGGEAWLAGALVFSEDSATCALFFAPEAFGDRALYVKPAPRPSIAWLTPLGENELAVGPEPPSVVEHRGDRFERNVRLPLGVKRMGTGAPEIGDTAIVGEYSFQSTEFLLIVIARSGVHAFRGAVLEEGSYDILPGPTDRKSP